MATRSVVASTSPRFSLNSIDWKKLGKSILLAAAGAVITVLLEQLPNLDFGSWTPFVTGAVTWILNLLRKWISGPA